LSSHSDGHVAVRATSRVCCQGLLSLHHRIGRHRNGQLDRSLAERTIRRERLHHRLLALVNRAPLDHLRLRLGYSLIDHAVRDNLLRSLNLLWLSLIDHAIRDNLLRSLNLLWLSLIDRAIRDDLLRLLAGHNYLLRLLVDNMSSREGTIGLVLKQGEVRLRLKVE